MIDFSVVVPVYRNEGNIHPLLRRLADIHSRVEVVMEVVFVVDGSPDCSRQLLLDALGSVPFPSQLLTLSRNFGSFNAIRAGLQSARGKVFGIIAADLQEPPELLLEFASLLLEDRCDVCVGKRVGRDDGPLSRLSSNVFWCLYRIFVQSQMPPGGLDVFGCNRKVRDTLVALTEANSSLVGQLIWLGFRREEITYCRQRREVGNSGWTFRRKWKYMADSIFSFTDFPIRMLTTVGVLGATFVAAAGSVVLIYWLVGAIDTPGYTALMLAVLFVGFTNLMGLGIIGNYVWRCFENSKNRPLHVVMDRTVFGQPWGDA